jgi:hypothetical protein
MTAQMPDVVRHNDEEYVLVGVKGRGLFSPKDFGMTPVSVLTSCYRGYWTEYTCDGGGLWLTEMTVSAQGNRYGEIGGVEPMVERVPPTARYEGIRVQSRFTGRLLIAKDLLQDQYVHMGFQKPAAYRTVIELVVEDGGIVEEIDRSEHYALIRKRSGGEKDAPADPADESEVKRWIAERFSLEYEIG